MVFPGDKVRAAQHTKLQQTGLPFFRLETCIEVVLQYMKEETWLALQQSSSRSVETETAGQQGAKLQMLQSTTLLSMISDTPMNNTAATASTSSSSSSLSSSSADPSSHPDPGASTSTEG